MIIRKRKYNITKNLSLLQEPLTPIAHLKREVNVGVTDEEVLLFKAVQ